jgi:hypothetical protein
MVFSDGAAAAGSRVMAVWQAGHFHGLAFLD